jgi:serine/threonine-protein kinase
LDRYEWIVGTEIGAGGGGSVHHASAPAWPDAAMKFIPKSEGTPRELLAAEVAEPRNILAIVDRGEIADYWVVAMPRAAMSLEEHLRGRGGSVSLDEAIRILTDVASALSSLRGRTVHRDVKPANILWHADAWQLADFGISRDITTKTATLTKKEVFSKAYAAPEQWNHEKVSAAIDVYAWGVIAFELLAGEWPFPGPTTADFKRQHTREPAPELVNLPKRLAILVEECLDKSAEARPSATEVLHRLTALDQARPPGHALLADVNAVAVRERTRYSVQASASKAGKKKRAEQYRSALAAFRRLSDRLWYGLRETATAARIDRTFEPGWCLWLREAPLRLGVPVRTVAKPWPAGKGPDIRVVAHARIDLSMSAGGSPYTGRTHSLWFCDADDPSRMHWYEVAFLRKGYPHRSTSHMPFALDPGAEAGAALLETSPAFEVQVPLTRLDHAALDAFVDRWAGWFAQAATGDLRFEGRR